MPPFGSDITDPIPYPLSNPSGSQSYAATGIAYDVAFGGLPFFLTTSDENAYRRVTAQYRKQQVDMSREPGEQTLTGWWLRSQSSFHLGQGIKFFEPQQDESLRFQFTYGKGCDVWTKGQITLLKDVNSYSSVTNGLQSNKRPYQATRSIRYSSKDAVLVWDGYKIDKVEADGTVVSFVNYTPGTDYPILSVCDDGTFAYWVTNKVGTNRLQVNKRPLDSSAAASEMFTSATITATNAVIEFTKERLVMAVNNSIYEFAISAVALPTAVYSHPNASFTYTSITSSGAAIYLSGYNGIQSTIQKFTLNTSGAMPTLTSAITAAELPVGEIVFKIYYYLGYMAIGTSLGLRVAAVSDQDGSINYGPLLFESEQPVYDVAGFDKYLWCTTNVDGSPGVSRVDLGQQVGTTLVFAYAWDLYDPTRTGFTTTACAFVGNTNRLAFLTSNNGTTNGKVYIESATVLVPTATLRVGYIRYNTLENKIFKFLQPRYESVNGSLAIYSIDQYNNEVAIGSFAQGADITQIGIPYPSSPQQYLGFKFVMDRSTTDSTKGPLFTGYQIRSLPSIPRQRLIQYPVELYDSSLDKFNNPVGYEGYAYDRLLNMQSIENLGDLIRVEDFRTGESYLGLIEEMDFINKTPTDKRYSGYGGLLLVTIRTA
jgi:hypothetical protein